MTGVDEPCDIPKDARDPRVQRTRGAVVEAVREIVMTAGPGAVTHQLVAERSGVGRATVYRHWPERRDLLIDALRPDEPWRRHPPTGDLRGDVVGHLRRMRVGMQRSKGSPTFLALVGHAAGDAALDQLRREMVAFGEADLRATLEDAAASGALRPDVDLDIAVAQLAGPIFYRSKVVGRPVSRRMIDDVVDAVLATIVA